MPGQGHHPLPPRPQPSRRCRADLPPSFFPLPQERVWSGLCGSLAGVRVVPWRVLAVGGASDDDSRSGGTRRLRAARRLRIVTTPSFTPMNYPLPGDRQPKKRWKAYVGWSALGVFVAMAVAVSIATSIREANERRDQPGHRLSERERPERRRAFRRRRQIIPNAERRRPSRTTPVAAERIRTHCRTRSAFGTTGPDMAKLMSNSPLVNALGSYPLCLSIRASNDRSSSALTI